ncbi:hypothetical protein [Nocardia jiangsuensis]|uniref:Uncharacterized protein n=1 Tax=Nocardia jiangsuensis TaxID=1691563 RepID=A0ABV8DXF6_9NOCA
MFGPKPGGRGSAARKDRTLLLPILLLLMFELVLGKSLTPPGGPRRSTASCR